MSIYHLMNSDTIILEYNNETKACKMINETLAPVRLKVRNEAALYHKFSDWLVNRATRLTRVNATLLYALAGQPRSIDGSRNLTIQYGGLSLIDNFWIKDVESTKTYTDVNMFDNDWDSSTRDIALLGLKGKQIRTSSPDLFVQGSWAKCYMQGDGKIYLYKADQLKDFSESKKESFVSLVAKLIGANAVKYKRIPYKGEICSVCEIETTKSKSWVTARDMAEYKNTSLYELGLSVDRDQFLKMLILWGITGNIDGHDENWSIEVDDSNNILGLAPCYDFNFCFDDSGDFSSLIDKNYTIVGLAKKSFVELGTPLLFSKFKTWAKQINQDDKEILFMIDYVSKRIEEISPTDNEIIRDRLGIPDKSKTEPLYPVLFRPTDEDLFKIAFQMLEWEHSWEEITKETKLTEEKYKQIKTDLLNS